MNTFSILDIFESDIKDQSFGLDFRFTVNDIRVVFKIYNEGHNTFKSCLSFCFEDDKEKVFKVKLDHINPNNDIPCSIWDIVENYNANSVDNDSIENFNFLKSRLHKPKKDKKG
tara:strand:+ start:418 stop:759 length:342 start_codon:yes stop_codon:yes gene_type:complete